MRRILPLVFLLLLAVPADAPGQGPGGRLQFALLDGSGAPALGAIPGSGVGVAGVVSPFAPGQSVLVTVARGRRALSTTRVAVRDAGDGTGRFKVSVSTGKRIGPLTIAVLHEATALQGAIAAPPRRLEVVSPRARPGSRGPSVRLLQALLARLHYALNRSGVFDGATGRAVEAFRKLTGLARTQQANDRVFQLLGRGAGAFHPRHPHQGAHFEADLSHQVLAEVTAGGSVRRIYPMSSGKPSTPTVIGTFHIYSQTSGTNDKGMVDANYFIGGYAIHGYFDVPPYPASHGCLRIPIPDAAAVFHWARYGDAVDVYTRGGGGSRRVRGNAGP
ncbi:MAG: L,D-transpeptidase [Solirubrobacteraceae bacterium]